MHTNLNSAKGRSVNFIRTFWCHHFDQNTTNFLRISALASKGQLISKWFFGVFDFFQKTNENKSTWGIIVVKSNSFVRFLEEMSAWKNHFDFVTGIQLRIILSFEMKKLKKPHYYKHISIFPVGILQMTREKVRNRIPSEFQFEKQTIAVEVILSGHRVLTN